MSCDTPQQCYYNLYFPTGLELQKCYGACNDINPFPNFNIVKDYRVLENQQDPGQVAIRQNVNTKHIRIENNSKKDLLVGLNLYHDFPHRPKPQFLLRGGEVRDLAINMPGEAQQFLWYYSPDTLRVLGDPHPLRWNINTFAINEGQNRFWVMDFYHKGYRGQI